MTKRSEANSKRSRQAQTSERRRRLLMEGLERRELLAVLTTPPTLPIPDGFAEFTQHRDVGTVQSFQYSEQEAANANRQNDFRGDAEFIPLGTGPGQEDTIDVFGSLPFIVDPVSPVLVESDFDFFSFDLRAGDILDVSTQTAAGGFTIFMEDGRTLYASDVNLFTLFGGAGVHPPLQTVGNATGTVVIPYDGTYTIGVAPLSLVTENYTLGLRVYRPMSESLLLGDAPILYLDFDGALLDNASFGTGLGPGVTRIPSFLDSLPLLGLEVNDVATGERIMREVIDRTIDIYADLANTGGNGDFGATGNPGEYAIRILNSLDHRNEVSLADPRLTRMMIGGSSTDIGIPGVVGIAQSVDIGNFDLNEVAVFALDTLVPSVQNFPIAPTSSIVDGVAKFLGTVVAHEGGHTFGMIHTENDNSVLSVSDAGGSLVSFGGFLGVGPDGIFGTLDDTEPRFLDDQYETTEIPSFGAPGNFGFNYVTNSLAHTLTTGIQGGSITGRIFNDLNRNGVDNNEPGIAGVMVFADNNDNGIRDTGETAAETGADGSYALGVAVGAATNVYAMTPTNGAPTTPVSVPVNGPASGIDFGFEIVTTVGLGRVYADANGNGAPDTGEGGVAGVFMYLDLDNDNRPDIGEPDSTTGPSGTYSLDFPGAGTFTIRTVVPAGFVLTDPPSGEYTVTYDGTGVSPSINFDFGLLPSTDFGDAPLTYGDASHGIIDGLNLGPDRAGDDIDREVATQASATATGDDNDGFDDEDGFVQTGPFSPGAPASYDVTVNNTSGVGAFLQGFIDANRDGDFLDAGEQFLTDLPVAAGFSGTLSLTSTVPASALIGSSFLRFRLSQTAGVGPVGFVTSGEVEDYAVQIVDTTATVNADTFTISRNSLSNQLDVLANDFQTAATR